VFVRWLSGAILASLGLELPATRHEGAAPGNATRNIRRHANLYEADRRELMRELPYRSAQPFRAAIDCSSHIIGILFYSLLIKYRPRQCTD
jgi:hypothetical protein